MLRQISFQSEFVCLISQVKQYINILCQMNKPYKVQDYEIVVNFKSDTVVNITAEHLPTQEFFSVENVELMRVKKETILATLQKKSQKNLSCKLEQQISEEGKSLTMTFVVNFDFLPEFREEIKLDFMARKEGENMARVGSCFADIRAITEALDTFDKNGVISADMSASVQTLLSNFKWNKELERGRFLLRVTGTYLNTGGQNTIKSLIFTITTKKMKEPITVNIAPYVMSVYVYPFSFSEIIECEDNDEIEIKAKGENQASGVYDHLKDVHISTAPIFDSFQ